MSSGWLIAPPCPRSRETIVAHRILFLFLLIPAASAAFFFSGLLTSQAVQDPTVSLDMVTTGNSYDETTNSMTLGSIENCLTSATANPNTHIHTVHVVIQNVEELVGWQARLNYLGNQMRPNTVNFIPFADNNTGQNISFLNLPIDQASLVHRDLVTASSIPPTAPGDQTALVGAVYNAEQNFAISPDTPPKAPPDDTSYSTNGGGVLASLSLQVLAGNQGNPSLFINLDDGNPNVPGSDLQVFTGNGLQTINVPVDQLGDGYHGEGATCVPLGCVTSECPPVTPTPTAPPTPAPTPTATQVTAINDTGVTADALHFFVHSSSMTLTAEVSGNAPGCATPTATVNQTMGIDFTFDLDVVWPTACVDSGESVTVKVSCLGPCGFMSTFGCEEWTLSGLMVGTPCPTYFVVTNTFFSGGSRYGTIFEYKLGDTHGVVRLQVPGGPIDSGGARDITVDGKNRLAVYNGTFDPYLSTYDPADGSWTHHTFPGWSTVDNVTYGGIASFGDYIYVTDMRTFGDGGADEEYGIVRFDINDYSAERFATPEFIDLNIGLNGLLYAVHTTERAVTEYDPLTMQPLRSFGVFENVRGVAVNRAGHIFTAGLDGIIRRLEGGPNFEAVSIPGARLWDIDVAENGSVVVSGGYQVVTDESLDHVASFFDPPGALFSSFNTGVDLTPSTPTPTPTPDPRIHDGRARKIGAATTVVLSDGTTDVREVHVQVRNDGDHTESFGVYADVVPPGGESNPYACTPAGRVIDTVVTLAPAEQTTVKAFPTFNCGDVAGAQGQAYAISAAVDVHRDDGGACAASQIQSMACYGALADDDGDDADNRTATNAFRVK